MADHPDNSDSLQTPNPSRHCRLDSNEETTIDFDTATTPAWIVCAWPPLLWQASRAPQLHLTHFGTRVLTLATIVPCTGQTLWGDEREEQIRRRRLGLGPDWMPGVVAMSDPLGLVTNLKLLDDQGEALTDVEAAVRLRGLECMHLPWQVGGPARIASSGLFDLGAQRLVGALQLAMTVQRPPRRGPLQISRRPLQRMLSAAAQHG